MQEEELVRFTLDTDTQLDQTLADLVKLTGGTKADALRKAVATYKFLKAETADPVIGSKVSITNAANKVIKDIILPYESPGGCSSNTTGNFVYDLTVTKTILPVITLLLGALFGKSKAS